MAIKPFAGCFLNQHELSLRWILEKPFDVAVPGMWRVDEVVQNARLLKESPPLTEPETVYLNEERKYWYYELCRFCYQCKKCPEGVSYRSIVMLPLGASEGRVLTMCCKDPAEKPGILTIWII